VFLGIDRIVESLSAALTKAGARHIEATISDGTVRLAVDEEMNEAFTTFGNAVAPGAAVTIRGDLVGTRPSEGEERKGCALLSVSVRGEHERGSLKRGLQAVRRIAKRYGGAVKALHGDGEIRIKLYLPVLRGS
jgi:hypothetical protein